MAFGWLFVRNNIGKIWNNTKVAKELIYCNKRNVQINNNLRTANKRLEQQSTKFRSFVLGRYLNYVKEYDKVLESKFPAAMQVYRVFIVGTKDFLSDLKEFLKIRTTINKKGFKTLNRKEIELYHKMPKDMIRVAPVLLLSAVPLSNYVIFPLAYFFPRVLLSSHFWSIQQRSDFAIFNLTKRLAHYKPVFRHLQERVSEIAPMEQKIMWSQIIALLGSGQEPNTKQIICCKELFERDNIYNLYNLKNSHVKELLRMHGLHSGLFRRTRLADYARVINEMDLAIDREGGATNMSSDVLKNACFIRGLNATNMNRSNMVDWINKWIVISKLINQDNVSLLLHCPILLAYNQPSNWMLIYNNRYKDV